MSHKIRKRTKLLFDIRRLNRAIGPWQWMSYLSVGHATLKWNLGFTRQTYNHNITRSRGNHEIDNWKTIIWYSPSSSIKCLVYLCDSVWNLCHVLFGCDQPCGCPCGESRSELASQRLGGEDDRRNSPVRGAGADSGYPPLCRHAPTSIEVSFRREPGRDGQDWPRLETCVYISSISWHGG